MMSRFFLILSGLFFTWQASAYQLRDLLQKEATLLQVKEKLLSKTEWIKYPAYTNRAGWDVLTGSVKQQLISEAELFLHYEWKLVKATDYLEYERSGSRVAMENPFGDNNKALSRLVIAELAEGKGRFMDQIINGVWQACEM